MPVETYTAPITYKQQLKVKPVETPVEKKAKPRMRWNPNSILLNVTIPELNTDTKKKHKKYKVMIRYQNGETGKIERKTIWFGDPKGEFIDDHDEAKRLMRHDRLGHQNDPFHGNYWRLHLLNSEPTIEEAYINFVGSILNYRKINS